MAKTIYFRVAEHGTRMLDTYRPLGASDLRDVAQQALAAAQAMERDRTAWLCELIVEIEERLAGHRAELAELRKGRPGPP